MSTDPVCGMEVYENLAPAKTEYDGVTFYFCSTKCWGRFIDDPDPYVKEQPTPLAAKAA